MTEPHIKYQQGKQHALYRYNLGSAVSRNGYRYGQAGSPAAKCKCREEPFIGEDEIQQHLDIIRRDIAMAVPPGARSTDPDTSHAAAGRTFGRKSQGLKLLRAYAAGEVRGGLTNAEAGYVTGYAHDPTICYWKRCSELAKMGLIEATGEKRPSPAGRAQRVHRITQKGYDYLEAIARDEAAG